MDAHVATATVRRALRFSVALSCAALAGCQALFGPQGLFPSRENDYLEVRPVPALRYPKGMQAVTAKPLYPLPEQRAADALPERFELQAPEPLVGVSQDPRLQVLGDRRWLVVDHSPVELWPQMRGMLAARGAPLAKLHLEGGSLTTAWMVAEDGPRERYLFQLRSGLRSGTSEMQARHQLWRDGVADSWPERSDDPGKEREMLLALAQYLAPAGLRPIASLVAQQVAQQPRMLLIGDGDALQLEMNLDYARGWALLGLALRKAEILVADEDRSGGVLYVKWLPRGERRQGFWSRLVSRNKTFEQLRDEREEIRLQLRQADGGRLLLEARRSSQMTYDQTRALLLLVKGYMG